MRTLNGFHHVKLPVSDVARSRDWYGEVMGLRVDLEFVEDGFSRAWPCAPRMAARAWPRVTIRRERRPWPASIR